MVAVSRTGVRVGAAVFAVGLSLAGPNAVAVADDGDAASPPGRGAPQQSGPAAGPAARGGATTVARGSRQPRPAESAPAAGASEVLPSVPEVPAQRAARGRPLHVGGPDGGRRVAPAPGVAAAQRVPDQPSLPDAPAPAVLPSATTPLAAPTADVGAATVAALPVPAAAAAGQCTGCGILGGQAGVPVREQRVTAIVRAARFIDGVASWLSGLPASPFNEFLSGALMLVRRTLFPMVPTIPAVSVGDVLVDETGTRAVFTVTLQKAYQSTVTVGYTTTSVLTDPGAELGDIAARATVGVDYQAASGVLTFAPGQTSQQVSVSLLDDAAAEVTETFGLQIVATWLPGAAPAATDGAAATAPNQLTSVVLASGTATIVDDDRVGIDANPNFAYGDVMIAGIFAGLAYEHRKDAEFSTWVSETGWQGIGVAEAGLGPNGFSPAAGGYGVRDGLTVQSYAFAGKRTAADGTEQFVVAFEGSNLPADEPADWIVNVGRYGWSRYYASLEPLMTEVVGQVLAAQQEQKKTQLILTGHSLGGAAAMMAFADLLAPQGDLWPGSAGVLTTGRRVLDTVGGWSPEVRTALLAATSVYTFGAPSILIEPVKLATSDAAALVKPLANSGSGILGMLRVLPKALGSLFIDNKKLPDLTGLAGITFGTRVFQFEHANSDWVPPRSGDIVAQIGSRDPGKVLQINLDNALQDAYTGSYFTSVIPGTTHFMDLYQESVTRLVTNNRVLKSPNRLSGDSPKLPQTGAGKGSDTRNDFFVNTGDDGRSGNDLFVFSNPGSYTANGGAGSDAYSITGYDVALIIDGASQSGRDTVVFDLTGTPGATYVNDTAVFSVTGVGGKSSSVTITHWDRWQVSDIFQVIKPANGRWTLDAWTDIDRGAVRTPPAGEIPLSVL